MKAKHCIFPKLFLAFLGLAISMGPGSASAVDLFCPSVQLCEIQSPEDLLAQPGLVLGGFLKPFAAALLLIQKQGGIISEVVDIGSDIDDTIILTCIPPLKLGALPVALDDAVPDQVEVSQLSGKLHTIGESVCAAANLANFISSTSEPWVSIRDKLQATANAFESASVDLECLYSSWLDAELFLCGYAAGLATLADPPLEELDDLLEDIQALAEELVELDPPLLRAVMAVQQYSCNFDPQGPGVELEAHVFIDPALKSDGTPFFTLSEVDLDTLSLNNIPARRAVIHKDVIVAKFHAKAEEGTLAGPCPLTLVVGGLLADGTPFVASDPAGNPHLATPVPGAEKLMRDLGYLKESGDPPPVAVCKDAVLQPSAQTTAGGCCVTVSVTDVDGGSFDPDGQQDIASLTVEPQQVCGAGSHPVTLRITDREGNSDFCQATVVVQPPPPQLECPGGLEVDSPFPEGVEVQYQVRATSLCFENVQVTCQPPSGAFFSVGRTTVSCLAADPAEQRSSCSFDVTVRPPRLAVECVESFNPAGQPLAHAGPNTPAVPAGAQTPPGNEANGKGAATGAGNGPPAATNPDAYYILKCSGEENRSIYVGLPTSPLLFGPFLSGTVVKITEAAGATPSMKAIGGPGSEVAAHITVPQDPLVTCLGTGGNQAQTTCFVPPPPQ